MVPCDGLSQWALGSGEAVGIFEVAEDRELSLTPGTLCVPCESWSSASQETPTFYARPVLTLTSSCAPLLAQVLPALDTQLLYEVFLFTPAPSHP